MKPEIELRGGSILVDSKGHDLEGKILEENINVHRLEAPIYERIHAEIFNSSTQRELEHDLSLIRELLPPDPLALDIGCGTGNISLKLLDLGFKVTAIDISEEMLDILKKKVKHVPEAGSALCIVCSDVDSFFARLAQGKSGELALYDCVIMHSVLHHLPNWSSIIESASEFISDGGLMYIAHEPTKRRKDSWGRMGRFLNKLDSIPTRLWMILHGISPLDYSLSDYYAGIGFDSEYLTNLLYDCGLRFIFHKEYCSYKTRFAEILGRLVRIRPNCLKLLARKQRNCGD